MNEQNTIPPLPRRTWVYVRPPREFEVAGCQCGNEDTQWSEFSGHCWCEKCQKDFVPAHNGIFDGLIPFEIATMMGICFDRIDLATGKLMRFDIENGWFPDGSGFNACGNTTL